MRRQGGQLVNFTAVEAVPARFMAGRDAATARALAGGGWLLRRKLDGRYLALVRQDGVQVLEPAGLRIALGDRSLADVRVRLEGRSAERCSTLAPGPVARWRAALGIPADYAASRGLGLVAEPARLRFAGHDVFGRVVWLQGEAALAWQRMRAQARRHGVLLQAVSGYRSQLRQFGIVQRKLAQGQAIETILEVNAAPGYSEHHSGRALDLAAAGAPVLEEAFEHTAAFAWLGRHAAGFGFRLSYPRDNPHGIAYEPWHWRYAPRCDRRADD